jgi:poly-gamma-glutamate synthesis protein (capsule biosynthesis protein)
LIILSFGWETIGCKAATKNKNGVNPYDYKWIEFQVNQQKTKYPNYKIILYVHWNYEFETLPLPADRQFAHHLIDIGVDGIFGHHPHIINGYEIYKDKAIFYSLGNFYMPQIKFGNHQLNYRTQALDGISVEYDGNIENLRIFHHSQDKTGTQLQLKGKYRIDEFERISKLSGFHGLDHKSYINFYKQNRFHKRKLLPIYKSYKNEWQNYALDLLVKLRQLPIDFIAKLK